MGVNQNFGGGGSSGGQFFLKREEFYPNRTLGKCSIAEGKVRREGISTYQILSQSDSGKVFKTKE